MGGVKAFLTKTGPFGVPVYAYLVGAVALVGGIIYFKTRPATSTATAAPQTTNPIGSMFPGGTSGGPVPLPYPTGNPPPVPPSPSFSTDPTAPFTIQNADGSTSTGSGSPMPTASGSVWMQDGNGNWIPNPALQAAQNYSPSPTTSQRFLNSNPLAGRPSARVG